jgi:hypothetical protein
VFDALPLTNQARAGDRTILGGYPPAGGIPVVEVSRDLLETFERLRFQPSVGELLDPVRQPVLQKPSVIGRWFGLEEIAPLVLKGRYGQRLQRCHTRQNRISQSKAPGGLRALA